MKYTLLMWMTCKYLRPLWGQKNKAYTPKTIHSFFHLLLWLNIHYKSVADSQTEKNNHLHSQLYVLVNNRILQSACFWTVGGIWGTWEKPCKLHNKKTELEHLSAYFKERELTTLPPCSPHKTIRKNGLYRKFTKRNFAEECI